LTVLPCLKAKIYR